jgi:hypothetical protein
MSVDTVNQALTAVRLRIGNDQTNAFSPEGKRKLVDICGIWRYWLMMNNPNTEVVLADFNTVVDNYLRNEPDATTYLLDELFEELGFPEGVREQLDAALAVA